MCRALVVALTLWTLCQTQPQGDHKGRPYRTFDPFRGADATR
jgi:hypothetical protein